MLNEFECHYEKKNYNIFQNFAITMRRAQRQPNIAKVDICIGIKLRYKNDSPCIYLKYKNQLPKLMRNGIWLHNIRMHLM